MLFDVRYTRIMSEIERAHIFLLRERKLLVLEQAGGWHWRETPGGEIEHDETPADAAVRETFEETGLRVAAPQLLRMWTVQDHHGRVVRAHQFIAEAPCGAVVLSDEHRSFLWMAVETTPHSTAQCSTARRTCPSASSCGRCSPTSMRSEAGSPLELTADS